MKSYGEYCAIARSLDVVGDRWSLLIVRELLGGPHGYTELLKGLPGIATNLLAQRLRHLEDQQVVERTDDGRYVLTPWGQGLREALYALARWSAPVLMSRPAGDDAYRDQWLVHLVAVVFEGIDRERPAMTVEIHVGDRPQTIISANGSVWAQPGRSPSPDLVLNGSPDAITGLLTGYLDGCEATRQGVAITGDPERLHRLRPSIHTHAASQQRD